MPLRQPLQTLSLSPSGRLLAAASGPHIHVVDVQSGRLVASCEEATRHAKGFMVRHLVWHGEARLVSGGEDKVIKEWRIPELEGRETPAHLVLEQQFDIPKRANAISVTHDGQSIVVADKFGDVYAFPMHDATESLPAPPVARTEPEASTSQTPADDLSDPKSAGVAEPRDVDRGAGDKSKRRKVGNTGGVRPEWRHVPARISALTPVLGHVSMLTAMLVLSHQHKIITADRDEHIRVSNWPRGWEIEHFLLGQQKFVSALALLPTNPNVLISAGGDEHVRLWDLETYRCIRKDISLAPLVGTAEVKVELPPPKMGRRMLQKINRKKQRQAKENGTTETDEAVASTEDQQPQAEEAASGTVADLPGFRPKVRKLDLGITQMVCVGGVESSTPDAYVVMSSVGSSALLAWPASRLADPAADINAHTQLLSFEGPVLSISASPAQDQLWVSLDVSGSPDAPAVQVLHVENGKLVRCEDALAKTVVEQCTFEVSEDNTYPNVPALFPDMALLSKEGFNAGTEGEGDPAEEEGSTFPEID